MNCRLLNMICLAMTGCSVLHVFTSICYIYRLHALLHCRDDLKTVSTVSQVTLRASCMLTADSLGTQTIVCACQVSCHDTN